MITVVLLGIRWMASIHHSILLVPLVAADGVTVQPLDSAIVPGLVSIDRDDDPALSCLDCFFRNEVTSEAVPKL